jgi:hypothetical protein
MLWIGLGLPPTYAGAGGVDDTNRLGSHLGAMAQSRPGGALPAGDVATAEHLGRRVAEAVARWKRAPIATSRHPHARSWSFPQRVAGVDRVNLRELAARPDRFEHHLVVVASIGAAQLEIATASEPLYFAHVNISDEYAVALLTGDGLVDRFPMRTFVSDPATGDDVARYNHRVGDLVLHPFGLAHWPGRLRPPYEPHVVPPGMRRCAVSLVYCASQPTASTAVVVPPPAERAGDVKIYAGSPTLVLAPLDRKGVVAAVAGTTLEVVCEPQAIAPPRGGWVVVLDGDAPTDLIRIPEGGELAGAGISRALVFASPDLPPDPPPPVWRAQPPPAFVPFEDAAAGSLPVRIGALSIDARSDALVEVAIGDARAEVPRYWLARMLFRVGLHRLRLNYVETYNGFYIDDRDDLAIGLRGRGAITIPRADALAVVERLYRAVAPPGYTERLT